MVVDLDKYRIQIPFIKYLMDKSLPADRFSITLSMAAVAAPCPVIAVAYYAVEFYGMSPEAQLVIDRLTAYYRIKEVRGIK